jgi:Spy/CpxP family protein refolding chaperone
MDMRFSVLSLVTLSLLAGCMEPGSDPAPSSSYPALQDNEVRGLTDEEIAGLRSGSGMGYALPAELNGYPGPKHVLEFAAELGLNASQREETTALRADMLEAATSTGEALIHAYAALDQDFRSQSIDEETLRAHTTTIGRLEGELRAIHMEAHLAMMTILTHDQVLRYSELRGYEAAAHGEHDHDDMSDA